MAKKSANSTIDAATHRRLDALAREVRNLDDAERALLAAKCHPMTSPKGVARVGAQDRRRALLTALLDIDRAPREGATLQTSRRRIHI